MTDDDSIVESLQELWGLYEQIILSKLHQSVEKHRQKVWHDCHIKNKYFFVGDKILLYNNNYLKHPRKLQMHWQGPFIVVEIKDYGAIKLAQIYGIFQPGWVNDTCLKNYFGPWLMYLWFLYVRECSLGFKLGFSHVFLSLVPFSYIRCFLFFYCIISQPVMFEEVETMSFSCHYDSFNYVFNMSSHPCYNN